MEGLEFATKKKKSVEEEEGPRKVEWDPNEEDTFNPLANRQGYRQKYHKNIMALIDGKSF